VSPAFYFNLGNAYYRAGEPGRAIATYRDAEQLAPRDPDIQANLQLVRGQVQGPTIVPGHRERWLGRFTLNEWALATSLTLWGWLLLMTLLRVRRGILIGGGLAVALLAGGTAAAAKTQTRGEAIVVKPAATVHNGPFEESPAAFTAHDGSELRVLDRKDLWVQVTAGARRIGWIRADDVILRGR
jgi:hypothetical protein